jgi:hypothetical protein
MYLPTARWPFDPIGSRSSTERLLWAPRIDRDPSVSIPIEQIEEHIRSAETCLADISTNNPNVWFELGYALACQKEVVLVCSKEREPFPFDVQHRTIIRYSTESPRHFTELKAKITARLKAILTKVDKLSALPKFVADVEGLRPHEMVGLVVIASSLSSHNDEVSAEIVRRNMQKQE